MIRLPVATTARDCSTSALINLHIRWIGNCTSRVSERSFRFLGVRVNRRNSSALGSSGFDARNDLGFKEKLHEKVELTLGAVNEEFELSTGMKGVGRIADDEWEEVSGKAKEDGFVKDTVQDERRNPEGRVRLDRQNLVGVDNGNSDDLDGVLQEPKVELRSVRKLMMKRSNMLAKQVISIQSALSLGFISQIWVDTTTWLVLVVEVRPSLLSSESEKFLFEDIKQVGDVVLVSDESVLVNAVRMFGMETLVGYNVVTPGHQIIGKVRGYTFDIYSGIVESLELDSFGISIIPSNLVSTYALFVEDVLEVAPDTVIVHEEAASRVQRLTKGFWAGQSLKATAASKAGDKYPNRLEDEPQPASSQGRSRKPRNFRKQRFYPGTKDDWDLPIDYL